MKLDKKVVRIAAAIICVIILGCVYASFSARLKKSTAEYNAIKSQLEDARARMRLIGRLKESGLDSEFMNRLLSKSDLPTVLDTFMRIGKGCGVSLPGITPQEAQDVRGLNDIVRVPLTIQAESKCRNLGEFLNNLIKELRAAMVQVDSLEIKKAVSAKDETKLEAVIEISMYVKK